MRTLIPAAAVERPEDNLAGGTDIACKAGRLMVESFHRPHPAKEAKHYQVRAARAYLIRLGVTP